MSSRHNLTALTLNDCSLCVCGHTGQLHRNGGDCGIGTCACQKFQAITQAAELAALQQGGGMADSGELNSPAVEAVAGGEPVAEATVSGDARDSETLGSLVGSSPTPATIPEEAVVESLAWPKDNHCLRCGHDWDTSEKMKARGKLPVACPLCRSAYWDKPAEMQTASIPSPERRVDLFDRQKAAQMTRRRRLLERRLTSSARELGVAATRELLTEMFPPPMEALPDSMYKHTPIARVATGILPPPPTFED